MILTRAEHAEVLRQMPGPIYLTVEGDRERHFWTFPDPPGWMPPSRFVEATGPCEHVNATAPVYNGGNYGNYGTQRCKDCGATRDDWSDWHGGTGRKRAELRVTCPEMDMHLDGDPGDECDYGCDDNHNVLFAHATIEVFPSAVAPDRDWIVVLDGLVLA